VHKQQQKFDLPAKHIKQTLGQIFSPNIFVFVTVYKVTDKLSKEFDWMLGFSHPPFSAIQHCFSLFFSSLFFYAAFYWVICFF